MSIHVLPVISCVIGLSRPAFRKYISLGIRRQQMGKIRAWYLRAVYTRVFCVRFSVQDGAANQLFPLRDHVRDRARKAKEAVWQWRHQGQRNGRKTRESRRPFNDSFSQIWQTCCLCTCTFLIHFLSCSVCFEAMTSNFLYASSVDVCWVMTASKKSYRWGPR
jgi:hypothetical protein